MARAVPGAVPGAQGQANPLAQGLTEGGGAALVPADPEGAEDRQWDSGASMKGNSIGHLDPSPGSPAVH